MPPKSHDAALPKKQESSTVSSLHQLTESDYVLTTNKQDGSINIWSTKAGLTNIQKMNFKLQAHIDPKRSLARARLQHLNYDPINLESGATLFLKNSEGLIPSKQPEESQAEATDAIPKKIGDSKS